MKPYNSLLNPDAGLPPWLLTLQQAVGNDELLPEPDQLLPLAALSELVAAAASPPTTPEDVASLQSDLGDALGALGSDLSSVVAVAADEFRRNTIGHLRTLLATPQGATIAGASAQTVSARLQSDVAVVAAWRDCVRAFRGVDGYPVCVQRVAMLREIVEHRGHSWTSESALIVRVINDSADHVHRADGSNAALPHGQHFEFEDRAGLSEDQRLAIVEQRLRTQLPEEEIVIWLMIYDAAVADGVVEVGPVRFIDVAHMRERVFAQAPEFEPFSLPEGLEQFLATQLISDLQDGDQAVLARVQTTTRAGEALTWARRTVTALIDVATLDRRPDGWRLADGHLVSGDRAWSHHRFSPAGSGRFRMDHAITQMFSRPDRALAQIDERIVSAWIAGREDATNAIELARWERALAALPDEVFRVALGVRNLERTLPAQRIPRQGGQLAHWTSVAAYYLKDGWVWHSLLADLRELQVHSVSPTHLRPPEPITGARSVIGIFYRALDELCGTQSPSLAQLVEHAAALADLAPEQTAQRRLLAQLATDTADRDATLDYLGRFDRRFDLLLARAARQRNASVHGTATVPAVISNVLPFTNEIGRHLVSGALTAATENEPLPAWLEHRRLVVREDRAELAAGRTLAELLASKS